MAIDITNKEEKQIALTGAEIEETLLQAHLSKDVIAKIDGLQASASEINENTLKTFDKAIKTFQKNPIDGAASVLTRYIVPYPYNNEEFNAIKTYIKVSKDTTVKAGIITETEMLKDWWARKFLASGEIEVKTTDRYVEITLDKLVNSSNIIEDNFYVYIGTEESVSAAYIALHNCEITDPSSSTLLSYNLNNTNINTNNGNRTFPADYKDTYMNFWFQLIYKDNHGLRIESIEQSVYEEDELSEIINYPNFFNCEGVEAHIYFRNFQRSLIKDYGYKYNCNEYGLALAVANRIGIQEDERFIKYNTALVMGNKSAVANINFYDKFYQKVKERAVFNHITVDKNNGSGKTCKLVAIGESTTGNGLYLKRMQEISTTDVMSLTLLGTRISDGTKHEGVGGKTMTWQISDAGSAFTNASGVLDYSSFVTTVGGTPDVISIQLGINAMLLFREDYARQKYINQEMGAYFSFINHVKLTHAATKFIINTCILPSELQSSFGLNYDTYISRDFYRESIQKYNEALISLFKDRENEGIYLNCTQTLALDCMYGYDTEEKVLSKHTEKTLKRGVVGAGVHPSTYGYKLMGDALWACIKYIYKA